MRRASLVLLMAVASTGLAGCARPPAPGPVVRPAPPPAPVARDFGLDETRLPQLVNRIGWGSSPALLAQAQAMGSNAWLNAQINARDDALPAAIQQQIDAMRISQASMVDLLVGLEEQRKRVDGETSDADKENTRKSYQASLNGLAREHATRFLLRAMYSPNQLRQQMAWFWLNHFSVFQGKANLRAMVPDFEEQALRPNLTGKFRDLLRATVYHPAMLRYLDNERNAVQGLNENYARELMELHTLGVDGGYTQADVQELARILTGVGVNVQRDAPHLRPALQPLYRRQGAFEFNPRRHDFGDKRLLGQGIRGSGLSEVDQALDALARHPATARHISRKLALYFTGQEADSATLADMERAWRASDGSIAQVLAALFASPQFAASLGQQFKDPAHYLVSSLRLSCGERPLGNALPALAWLVRLGQGLNARPSPDGYPLAPASWNSPGQMSLRFEMAQAVARGAGDCQAAGERAPALAQGMTAAGLDKKLGPATREALAQARDRIEWNTLFLASPEFMQR